MFASLPNVRDVVLVGGGHSHVLLIRKWAMQPLPGVRLTLISEKADTPYSGMLPGLVAGHYTRDEVHIDLVRLCQWANVRFVEHRASAINLNDKQIEFAAERPSVAFDVLSLDTGSTPELSVPGSAVHSVPVKPVHGFYDRWCELRERIHLKDEAEYDQGSVASSQASLSTRSGVSVGVVGSGAGGFELIMAMQYALKNSSVTCHWFIRGAKPLKHRPDKVSRLAVEAAERAGIVVHTHFNVVEVNENTLHAEDGRVETLSEITWCTAARAPEWPADAGLTVDKRGFVSTNAFLQSVSHDYVFATGDIGTQVDTPSDKAGVFAVRQAPVLFHNLRHYLLSKPLKRYVPQKDFLSLMATGSQSAIGNRGPVTVDGKWVWRWKDSIDRRFMNQFSELPDMKPSARELRIPPALLKGSSVDSVSASTAHVRCRGCGGKVGHSILQQVLGELNVAASDHVVSGFAQLDDAAVLNVHKQMVVQSVDQITAFYSDPYVFARIATVHALNDIVASQAIATTAQVLLTLPFADESLVRRDLTQIMAGILSVLNAEGCALVGGHTAEGTELSIGLVVNGEYANNDTSGGARASAIGTASEFQAGDGIVVTKPLGSGVIMAGHMQGRANGAYVTEALAGMQQSNATAAQLFQQHSVKSLTDITGFGLLGHLHRLLSVAGAGASLMLSSIPLYSGAEQLARQGVRSSLLKQNQDVLSYVEMSAKASLAYDNLLCDPQTSGGLLGVVPEDQALSLVKKLREHGYPHAAIIGNVANGDTIALVE